MPRSNGFSPSGQTTSGKNGYDRYTRPCGTCVRSRTRGADPRWLRCKPAVVPGQRRALSGGRSCGVCAAMRSIGAPLRRWWWPARSEGPLSGRRCRGQRRRVPVADTRSIVLRYRRRRQQSWAECIALLGRRADRPVRGTSAVSLRRSNAPQLVVDVVPKGIPCGDGPGNPVNGGDMTHLRDRGVCCAGMIEGDIASNVPPSPVLTFQWRSADTARTPH